MQRHIITRSSSLARTFCSTSRYYAPAAASTEGGEYRSNPRHFDSLAAGRRNPNAIHYALEDRPSLQFVVRPAPSPIPATLPHPSVSADSVLPPRLNAESTAVAASMRSTLTPAQVREMQSLRLSNPSQWTRSKLAEKYNVSKFFVSTVGFGDSLEGKQAARMAKEEHEQRNEIRQSRWGMKKRVDREVRRRRKEFW